MISNSTNSAPASARGSRRDVVGGYPKVASRPAGMVTPVSGSLRVPQLRVATSCKGSLAAAPASMTTLCTSSPLAVNTPRIIFPNTVASPRISEGNRGPTPVRSLSTAFRSQQLSPVTARALTSSVTGIGRQFNTCPIANGLQAPAASSSKQSAKVDNVELSETHEMGCEADLPLPYGEALAAVPGLMAAITEAELPPSTQSAIGQFCEEEGAKGIPELLNDDDWERLSAFAEIKRFEKERLRAALESHLDVAAPRSNFWAKQVGGRPLRVLFVRHGESEANVDRDLTRFVPDHSIHLTAKGRKQALQAGKQIKEILGNETVKFITSPYVRTKETFNGIMQSFTKKYVAREDVRIREMEYGNYDAENICELQKEKKEFGAFYYRFREGESPADAYDRASIFLETLYRSWEDNKEQNLVIVCHGVMILVLLMRFFRMPIDDYSSIDSLKNGEIVCLERPEHDPKFEIAYCWAPFEEKDFGGLRRKKSHNQAIWDGDPDAPMLHSRKEDEMKVRKANTMPFS